MNIKKCPTQGTRALVIDFPPKNQHLKINCLVGHQLTSHPDNNYIKNLHGKATIDIV